MVSQEESIILQESAVSHSVQQSLKAILSEYANFTPGEGVGRDHRAWKLFEDGLIPALQKSEWLINHPTIKIEFSVGKGRLTLIPWVAFLDGRTTTSTQRGTYVVMLFHQDMSGVSLCLSLGVTELERDFGAQRIPIEADELRSKCQHLELLGFHVDGSLDIKADRKLGRQYQLGTAAYKSYDRESLPTDEQFFSDLEAILEAYDRVVEKESKVVTSPVSASQLDENALQKFLEQLKTLKVNKGGNVVKPYKPAMLAAVNNAIDDDLIKSNELYFDRLYPFFKQEMADLGFEGTIDQAGMGFFYLSSEPFWRFKLRDGSARPVGPEPAQLKKHVEFAYFTPEVWSILQHSSARQQVRQLLNEHWYSQLKNGDGVAKVVDAKMDEIHVVNIKDQFDIGQAVLRLIESIERKGYVFEPWQVAAYITAMRTKPFIILGGVSGTGKSRLPSLVAELTMHTSFLVPVRPDWTDSSDVIGYIDLQGQFRPGPLAQQALLAEGARDKQFVCILDEMNLARVEYYFAEVLSLMEKIRSTGERSSLVTHQLRKEDQQWSNITLPGNLAIVGTVNMDESTHGFSKKVLDRAFTIEMSMPSLLGWKRVTREEAVVEQWPASAWIGRGNRLFDLDDLRDEETRKVNEIVASLEEVNSILSEAQLQLGYRSRDEIALFVLNASELESGFVTRSQQPIDPFDLALQMKVLPRISGGSEAVKRLLLRLIGWAVSGKILGDETKSEEIVSSWTKSRESAILAARFPRTAARLCLMRQRLHNDGYTSYWM